MLLKCSVSFSKTSFLTLARKVIRVGKNNYFDILLCAESLGMCSSKSCVGPNTTNYILIPNKEESFHSASLGILSGADSPEGTYSCVPMDESHPNPDVHVCHLSSWKRFML